MCSVYLIEAARKLVFLWILKSILSLLFRIELFLQSKERERERVQLEVKTHCSGGCISCFWHDSNVKEEGGGGTGASEGNMFTTASFVPRSRGKWNIYIQLAHLVCTNDNLKYSKRHIYQFPLSIDGTNNNPFVQINQYQHKFLSHNFPSTRFLELQNARS